jgi:quinol---cytochrome c reductase iron-sulfur subunit
VSAPSHNPTRRPERAVAICFVVSILAFLGLFAVYAAGGQTQAEGALLFLALGGIGAGLMIWSKELMNIPDETHPRHPPPSDAEMESASDTVEAGVDEIRRRTFLSRLLAGAVAALGLAALFPIRSLGRAPGDSLTSTKWTSGAKLVTETGELVRTDTLVADAFVTVFPEGFEGSADSQAVLIRVSPPELLKLPPEGMAGAPEGLVAYSKVCTHAGCAIGLYLATDHELRCPCHQSTFDVLDGASPVYGPAPKPLPQLPIEVGEDGVLRAKGDFTAPVGPSFWSEP